ncbi:hypothetical protein Ancab_001222 [Ancistrocladus abbreviatus]
MMDDQEQAKCLASSAYSYGYPYPSNYDQSEAYTTDTMASNYVDALPLYSSYYSTMEHNSFPQASRFRYPGNYFTDSGASHQDKCQGKRKRSVDPRIINLLEPFRRLYTERKEMFREIFSGILDELSELFKKVNSLVSEGRTGQQRYPTMQRSLSLGSPPVDERFKIRALDIGWVGTSIQQDGKGGDPTKKGTDQGGGCDPKPSDSTCSASSRESV